MRFWMGLAFVDPTHLLPLARKAEEVGFEGVLLAEHFFYPAKMETPFPYTEDGEPVFERPTPFPEPWAAITAMAAVTERLRFSMSVYILPLHDPLTVAKAVSTAAVMSGDRVTLGAGAGWMKEEFDILGVDFRSRGRIFDEAIEVLRALWAGGYVEHHGEFFDFPPLLMLPTPRRPIPIWIGGSSPAALRRAARLGDGWVGRGHDAEEAAGILDELTRLRKEEGRNGLPFEAVVPLTPVTAAPERDVLLRLEDKGMTVYQVFPIPMQLGTWSTTLEQELEFLERYGDEVLSRLG